MKGSALASRTVKGADDDTTVGEIMDRVDTVYEVDVVEGVITDRTVGEVISGTEASSKRCGALLCSWEPSREPYGELHRESYMSLIQLDV